MEAGTLAAFKANERQKPCVVMKRTDSIYPAQLRSTMEESRVWAMLEMIVPITGLSYG